MKKWFTIFEMLLVVVIMWILMAAFKDFFLNKDKNKIYFDTCVARTYGQISTFLWDAMTQKMVYTGTDNKSPKRYIMDFDDTNQKIDFSYDFSGWVSRIGDSMLFSGIKNRDIENKCWEMPYYTKMESDNMKIKIAPGLKQWLQAWGEWSFMVTNNTDGSTITWEVLFSFCEWPLATDCMPKTKLVFDKRSFNITKKVCLKNAWADESCEEWSK